MRNDDYLTRPARVYQATNLVNWKRYIGVTAQPGKSRQYQHIAGGRHEGWLSKAIRKYGKANFRFEILARCDTAIEAFEVEAILIDCWRPEYNQKPGGQGGLPLDPEKRQYVLERLGVGRKAASERRMRPVICLTDGRRWDSVRDAALACGALQTEVGTSARGHHAIVKGMEFAYDRPGLDIKVELARRDAQRQKRPRGMAKPPARLTDKKQRRGQIIELVSGTIYASAADAARATGRTASQITTACRRLSVGRDGVMFRYPEAIDENAAWCPGRQRGVICVDTGQIFKSGAAAARAVGVSNPAIVAICNKYPGHHTAAGLHFEWAR